MMYWNWKTHKKHKLCLQKYRPMDLWSLQFFSTDCRLKFYTEREKSSKKLLIVFSKPAPKSKKDIQREMRDVIRQITASVTFLPFLDGQCKYRSSFTFDLQ